MKGQTPKEFSDKKPNIRGSKRKYNQIFLHLEKIKSKSDESRERAKRETLTMCSFELK